MSTILSGIQPTGNLHFGRYFGAVQNWLRLQEEYDCLYCVVDYHAMTMPFQPQKLRQNSWDLVINLLASGIKPENLFIQSLVPEHAELNWILNCFSSYGQLTRMTQFKDKSSQSAEKQEGFISVGLYTYPVLQAADILIYHATKVPVGKDQEQHLELTRNIAQRFNNILGKEYFALPEALYTEVPKVMSTADPTRKMSASLGEKHNIDLFAEPARIQKQIRSAVTDTGDAPAGEMSPGVQNLFRLLKASGQQEAHDSLQEDYKAGALKYSDLKQAVADGLIAESNPIRERKAALLAD
ncbi:MAG: tryptophan--tRNA ligase, partial [Bacteroidota bacterium]